MGRRDARKWDEPPLVTAARALVFWPLFAVMAITIVFAPGLIGGGLVVAAVRGAGGRIDGRIVMLVGGAVAAAGAFVAFEAPTPAFCALVYALITHFGLALGLRFGSEAPVRGGIYTHAGLAVLIALTAVALSPLCAATLGVTDPHGVQAVTLAMTTAISGIGLGLAVAPRRRLLHDPTESWGALPGLALVTAGLVIIGYRLVLHSPPTAFAPSDDPAMASVLLLAISVVLSLVVLHRALTLLRLRRSPELHVQEGARAQVIRADGSRVPVHVDAPDDGVTTLLAYELGGAEGSAYRGGMHRVTAERVFRGPRAEAMRIVASSALAWLGWALVTAGAASFGL